MIVVNFAHPITKDQLQAIEHLTVQPVEPVVAVHAQVDLGQPIGPQVKELVDRCGLSGEEWQTAPIVVNLPSLAVLAAAVVAELHGRMGYFPTVLSLRPSPGASPPRFELAELVNLQAIRDAARSRRMENM